MKKSIILMLWLLVLGMPSPAAANKFLQTTHQFHTSTKLNYVDASLGNTLNLYKISDTDAVGKKLYNPLNIYVSPTRTLTLKERRLLKKVKFFKQRRTRKYSRQLKKLKFYQKRRRKKFRNKTYLWKWFQKVHLLNSKKAI